MDRRNLAAHSPQGRKESGTPEATGHAGTQCSPPAKQAAHSRRRERGSAPGRRPALPLPVRPPGGAAAPACSRDQVLGCKQKEGRQLG